MSRTAGVTLDDAAETPAKGGKKKLLLLILVAVVAAAAGAWFFLLPGASAEAEEPVPGTVLVLEPVAVNLAGGGYLKIGVALQLTEDAAAEGEPDGTKASDLIISHFSQALPADVTGAREALKEALEEKIIETYEGAVIEIYYTEYVTQ